MLLRVLERAESAEVAREEERIELQHEIQAIREAQQEFERKLRTLVRDWQANANSRVLGDLTDRVWREAALQLLTVVDTEGLAMREGLADEQEQNK